jgi:hypothetical protein
LGQARKRFAKFSGAQMLNKKFLSVVLMTMTLLLLPLHVAPRVQASPSVVTFTVNSILDQPDDLTIPGTCHTAAGTCTLRAAVMQANRTSGAGATIIIPSGIYTLTIPAAGTDGEENGDLDLTAPISGNPVINIAGAGANTTVIDASQLDRVLMINPGCTVNISGVTIRNGFKPAAGGGGITNMGTLWITSSTISGNQALTGGGIENDFSLMLSNSTVSGNHAVSGAGIDNEHPLTVTNSTISRNSASSYGGGIENNSTLIINNSTISLNTATISGGGIWNSASVAMSGSTAYGNSANDGGAIINGNSLTVWNSTLTQNSAVHSGGGVYNQHGTANFYNVSIVFNSAQTDTNTGGSAGGVYNDNSLGAIFNLHNTLLAGNNVANSPIYDDCTGTLTSYGSNLFWMVTGCTVNDTAGGSHTTLNSLNLLGPLQNNGGPTSTVALLPGSNAIDGGDPAGCVDSNGSLLITDQRGKARPVGVRCDIGAYEYDPSLPLYLPLVVR